MKATWFAIGFTSVLLLFSLFSIIKFATEVGDSHETQALSAPVELAEQFELPVLKLADVGYKSNMKRSIRASKRYPYLAAIIVRSATNNATWNFVCFGSVISTRWIITAAHCLEHGNTFRALLYYDYILNRTITHPIKSWKAYPGFLHNSTIPWHDIALAKVDKDLNITVPVSTNIMENQKVLASVWKTIITMDRRTYLTNDMEIYEVHLINPVHCYQRYGFTLDDDTLICVNMTRENDCFITEFGPIFTPPERVLGVLRLMPNDCENKVAVFTNVTSYFDWISKEIGIEKEKKEIP